MEQDRNKYRSTTTGLDMYARFSQFTIVGFEGTIEGLSIERLRKTLLWASAGYESIIDVELLIQETLRNMFSGITARELFDACILATVAFIEYDPAYGYVAARLLFRKLFKEVTQQSVSECDVDYIYSRAFVRAIKEGVQKEILDPRMAEFDLETLALSLVPERDHLFDYMGLRTLYERYFFKIDNVRKELPQAFWMRVAMGVALQEGQKEDRAIEFYNLMALMRYTPSTPTLLHAALTRPQLSSCYLTTVNDDLAHIFKCIGDNAQMSKWSGGVANDWTPIRATGALIKSIKVESQGVIPYLKIVNDTTAAINRSGKRRSATVVYLETWHYDFEDFLDLKRNTGDERRRTHDINTAAWVPDLFMKRVQEDGEWTFFSPHEVSDLHDLYGRAFNKRYEEYEQKALRGEMALYKRVPARQLWRKMLTRLFETGHPWICFKDACNIRSPQDHVGVVHSSNLCTEITLNTSSEETAVCNLGSVNLANHVRDGKLDISMLSQTVHVAVRMLDNVIDINFYPTIEGKTANLRHRPIGLGIMGFQDACYKLNINFSSPRALEFASEVMEHISYNAILASSQLAKERGAYSSFKGSKWDRNIFPHDTLALLEQEREMKIPVVCKERLDWSVVRHHVRQYGMRNSNTMAIAPTATISNIVGCIPCIEPIYKNIYVKANMSGEFTVVNKYLVEDLKGLGLWDKDMLDQVKYYDGNLQMIDRIPQWIKEKYKEAFEIDPLWLVRITAARGIWIDQSQAHNVFIQGTSGKLLDQVYMEGWSLGLKTFYYLRSLGATQIEKATLDAQQFGFTQKREYVKQSDMEGQFKKVGNGVEQTEGMACSLSSNPECEACQ